MIPAYSLQELHLQRSWLTIGVFDGVHRGHQQIIRRLTAGAHAAGSQAVVLTFWPHPATVLGNRDFKCLTLPEERIRLLSVLDIDVVVVQTFDASVASTAAADFVAGLKEHLGMERLLIGYDFALGKGREGDAARLRALGEQLGYALEVVPA
ncbi:MAG TPA: FAD synthetase family protein, partial [Anaerolineales bacterium]|nr:FAD synthetase family protein [Anaerolineales bacterium]